MNGINAISSQQQQQRMVSSASSCASSSSFSTGVAEEATTTPSTTTFHKIIDLNNLACDYVHQRRRGCDYEKAIDGLTTAFHMLRKQYRETPTGAGAVESQQANEKQQQQQQQQQQPPSRISYYNADHFFFLRHPVEQRRESQSKKMMMLKKKINNDRRNLGGATKDQETAAVASMVTTTADAAAAATEILSPRSSALYNKPIRISKDDDEFLTSATATTASCSSTSVATFLLTTITFNLALMNHLYGLQLLFKEGVQDDEGQQQPSPPKSKSIEYLYNAGRLYEYTLRLEKSRSCYALSSSNAQSQQSSSSSFFIIMTPFIVMSILNNLGHLHFTLNQKEQSKATFERLQSTVMLYTLSRRGGESGIGSGSTADDPSSSLSLLQQQQQQQSRRSSPSSVCTQRRELIRFFFHNCYVGVNQQHRQQRNRNQNHLQGSCITNFYITAPAA
jgi:hypothetical protein